MLNTTVGQLLVNDALPKDMRDYNRVLDGKGVKSLLREVAEKHPDQYRDVSFRLNQIGKDSAQEQGGLSFGSRHLRRSKAATEIQSRISAGLRQILDDDTLTDKQRADKIVRVVGKEMEPQTKAVLEEALKDNNPLALQILSGSRGKPMNLASLLGSDLLYADHRDEVIPLPVLRSYSQGLSPEEYWAGTYGARKGIIATKFATQEAGFLSKQLNQAGHRLVVVDEEGQDDPTRGMVVDVDDEDNEGALLAQDVGPYKRNTPLTPKILKHLTRLGSKKILIRSPLVGGSPSGGVYARDVGLREAGKLPGRGEQVGLQAAQALSEPISQGQLSAKHSGGVAGQEKAVSGFQYINQLIQVPKRMQGGAAHSEMDGKVQRIEEAPAGGSYVYIDEKKHYVAPGYKLKVKKGDEVEAGDVLSDGIPNPALIVRYKGVGEGRRYFANEFRKAMASGGMRGHRRNIELLARGLINHVKLTEETDEHSPDDVVPYSTLEHTYKPRQGHSVLPLKKAVGSYLERPVLHYTIGTKIRPSMLADLETFGIKELAVHKDPPPFEPHMVRGMYQLQHDPDWMTQMYGSGLKKSLLNSVARGATSKERGTSFIPSLASTSNFGEDPDREVVSPKPSYALPKVEEPETSNSFFGGKFKLGMHKEAAPITQGSGVDTRDTSLASNFSATPKSSPLPKPTGPLNAPPNEVPPVNPPAAPIPQGASIAASSSPANPPPPANSAQASTDAVQRSRTNGSMLTDPNLIHALGSSFDQDPQSGLMAMLSATNPEAFMSLFGGGLPNRDLSIPGLLPQQPIQPPVQPEGPTIGEMVSGGMRDMAVQTNALNVIGQAAGGRAFSGPATNAANQAAQRLAKPVANVVNSAQRVPVLRHLVPTIDTAADVAKATAKGTDIAGDVATAAGVGSKFLKFAPVVGTALEAGAVGYDVSTKGWENTTNEYAQDSRDLLTNWDRGVHEIYRKPIDVAFHVFSPVKNLTTIMGAKQQAIDAVGDWAGVGARNVSDWWNQDDEYFENLPKSHYLHKEKEPEQEGGWFW